MKKKYFIYIFIVLFCFVLNVSIVNADAEYPISESKTLENYSSCYYLNEDKGYYGIYKANGLITVYIKKLESNNIGDYFNGNSQELRCTKKSDGQTEKVKIYKSGGKSQLADQNSIISGGGEVISRVVYGDDTCASPIAISCSSSDECKSSIFKDSYSACERIDDNDDYVDALKYTVDGNTGVIFRVIATPKIWAVSNKFSCQKKENPSERECVMVTVTKSATVSPTVSDDQGSNNGQENDDLPADVYTIANGESELQLVGYSSCRYTSSGGDPRNEFISIIDGPTIRVAKVPSEITHVYLKCNVESSSTVRDVTIDVDPSATAHNISDSDSTNPDISGETNSGEQDLPDHNWGDPEEDCEYIFGDITKQGSLAYMLKYVLRFIQILGPLLVIILTIVELVKTVASGDKDAMSKMLKKTSKRLLYAVLLFVFPEILDFILKMTNLYGTCNIK